MMQLSPLLTKQETCQQIRHTGPITVQTLLTSPSAENFLQHKELRFVKETLALVDRSAADLR
jgi:hypothetical protein